MLTVTIAGQQKTVASGSLTMPRVGVWIARLVANADTIPTGQIVATLAGVDMPAHIQTAELVQGMLHLRVVGGAGGMGKQARPKHYRNPTARHVLGDLTRDAGERLSSTCTADAMNAPLPYWTTIAGTPASPMTTGTVVQALADAVGNGCCWRILYDGSLWFGRETWPACPADIRLLEQDAFNASQVLGTDVLGIWPGTTVAGRRIDLVVHDIGDPPRSTVWFAEGHA
jgi:hypothetical protein